MADVAGYSFVFYFCAVLAMIGGAVSYYFIPDKKVTPGDETDDEDDALLQVRVSLYRTYLSQCRVVH